jgi:hypothetical protein
MNMTTEGSRFNSRQRQRIYSSKQRQEQIRRPPTLVSWTRLRGGQAGQPPEPLTYKGRYDVFEIIGNMVLVNSDFVVKEFLRNYPQLGHVSSKSFTQPFPGAHISVADPPPIQWVPTILPGGKASEG